MSTGRGSLMQAVLLMLLANFLDYCSTVVALRHGLAEANPLIAHTVSLGWFPWVKLGVPVLVGTYILVRAALSESEAYNGWMLVALRGLAVFFALTGVNNVALVLIRQ